MKCEELYQSMMRKVQCYHEINQQKAAWSLINSLTGRKVRERESIDSLLLRPLQNDFKGGGII